MIDRRRGNGIEPPPTNKSWRLWHRVRSALFRAALPIVAMAAMRCEIPITFSKPTVELARRYPGDLVCGVPQESVLVFTVQQDSPHPPFLKYKLAGTDHLVPEGPIITEGSWRHDTLPAGDTATRRYGVDWQSSDSVLHTGAYELGVDIRQFWSGNWLEGGKKLGNTLIESTLTYIVNPNDFAAERTDMVWMGNWRYGNSANTYTDTLDLCRAYPIMIGCTTVTPAYGDSVFWSVVPSGSGLQIVSADDTTAVYTDGCGGQVQGAALAIVRFRPGSHRGIYSVRCSTGIGKVAEFREYCVGDDDCDLPDTEDVDMTPWLYDHHGWRYDSLILMKLRRI
jgi:hypothetical protein